MKKHINTKICTKCKIEKELSLFYKDSGHVNGLASHCKDCTRKRIEKWRTKNLNKVRLKQKEYSQNHNNEIKNYRKWRRKNLPWRSIWADINKRCYNKNNDAYKGYGGRGIKNLFNNYDEIQFIWFRDKAYLMKKPSIDRIDNDGNYCLENCRFLELSINAGKDKRKPVLQHDLQGNFIKEWDSITSASNGNKSYATSIGHNAHKINKTAGGFIWRYKNE